MSEGPSSSAGGMASTTASSEPLSRKELYKRIRESSKDAVILEEMVRLGFWPAAGTMPDDPAEDIRREGELRAELRALQTEQARIADPERLRQQIRMERFAAARERRKETKARQLAVREAKAKAWRETRRHDLPYLGDGVSGGLSGRAADVAKLQQHGLPVLADAMEVAAFFDISVGELRFLSFHRRVSKTTHYRRFAVPKKTGGERIISAPMPRLKALQRQILNDVLSKVPLHDAAHGFRRDRTIVTAAKPHLSAPVVVNLDLRDFFPSVTYRRTKGLFRSLGYGEQVATIFALLCTEAVTTEVELDGERWFVHRSERFLPQGSPASPAITNLICRRLDAQLTAAAEHFGFMYTRYADDLTFSWRPSEAHGDDLSGEAIRKLLGRVRFLVEKAGFAVHPDKTRVMRKGRRREVVGIVVNDGRPRVEKKKIKQFRAAVHRLRTKGPEGVHFGRASHDGGDDIVAALDGYASFVLMVDAERGVQMKADLERAVAASGVQRKPSPTYEQRAPSWSRYEEPPEGQSSPAATPKAPAQAPRVKVTRTAATERERAEPEQKKPWWKFW
jgi:RNA-directed DNA polymerase